MLTLIHSRGLTFIEGRLYSDHPCVWYFLARAAPHKVSHEYVEYYLVNKTNIALNNQPDQIPTKTINVAHTH